MTGIPEGKAIAYKLFVSGSTDTDVEQFCEGACGLIGRKPKNQFNTTVYRFSPKYYPTLTQIDQHPALRYAWGWAMHRQGCSVAAVYWQWNEDDNDVVFSWLKALSETYREIDFYLHWQWCETASGGIMRGDQHPREDAVAKVDPFPWVTQFAPLLRGCGIYQETTGTRTSGYGDFTRTANGDRFCP